VAERLFGIETEYAVAGFLRGAPSDPGAVLNRLFTAARSRLPHLPDSNSAGVYLANGSRFYIDCGGHPEVATPECATPWEAVRYVQAGEALLQKLAGWAEEDVPGYQILFFRSNVDYAQAGATWGCHESYMHACQPAALARQIIPHLVSRIIYTGAGGFDNTSAGLRFVLSTRARHLTKVASTSSTSDRGIFHQKEEALCRGYQRLHVLCGESLCSETAAWLKTGVTALVVAMAEAGIGPGEAVQLQSPLSALHQIAGDPKCKAAVRLLKGGQRTALQIQRHYLEQAEAHLDREFMPPWAGEVCRQWRAILDQLENAPASAATTLDWAIKLALYSDRARRHAIAWESLPHWTSVLTHLRSALQTTGFAGRTVGADFLLSTQSPVIEDVARLTPFLREHCLKWQAMKQVLSLRAELFEADMRFGQLGPGGIFTSLDGAGVLAHRVEGVGDIEQAVAEPPATGRARLRGRWIRRLSGTKGAHECDWESVWDDGQRRMLDLGNPLETEERWWNLSADAPAPDDAAEQQARVRRFLESARRRRMASA
jgi:proteasome accessory factor A